MKASEAAFVLCQRRDEKPSSSIVTKPVQAEPGDESPPPAKCQMKTDAQTAQTAGPVRWETASRGVGLTGADVHTESLGA